MDETCRYLVSLTLNRYCENDKVHNGFGKFSHFCIVHQPRQPKKKQMKHSQPEYLAWIEKEVELNNYGVNTSYSEKRYRASLLGNFDVLEMKPIPNAVNVGEYAVGFNEMLKMLQGQVTDRLDEVMG